MTVFALLSVGVRPAARSARRAMFAALALLVAASLFLVAPLGAAPTQDRAHVGYADVETNGYGGSDSWGGSLRLFTGPDQSGETIVGYCIDRGLNYPRGTDPQWADANSGFALAGDVPAARGVSAVDRGALAYLLWRYGDTADRPTAGAMFVVTHLLSGDPAFGSSTLAGTTLGSDWPNAAAIRSRAEALLSEGRRQRGPWTLTVAADRLDDDRVRAVVRLVGPAGPITGHGVQIAVEGAGGDGTYTTDGNGVVTALVRPVSTGGAVEVRARVGATPSPYRVFRGRPGTQHVVTSGGDGAALSAAADVAPALGSLRIVKTTDNPAYQSGAGATFEIHRGTDQGPVVATATIGSDGRSPVVDDLAPGSYTVVETDAPTGQRVQIEHTAVTVVAANTATVAVVNEVEDVGVLELRKRDADTGALLGGATFRVAADRDGDGSFEEPVGVGPDGVPDTDDDGWWRTGGPDQVPTRLTGLLAGRYEVVEIAPPEGYTLPAPAERRRVVEVTYGAPGPDDDVVSVTIDVDNHRPLITTQVVALGVTPADATGPDGHGPQAAGPDPGPSVGPPTGAGSEDVPADPAPADTAPIDPAPIDPAPIDTAPTAPATDATPVALVAPGTEVRDRITIDNVAVDTAGTVDLAWYGPFDDPAAIACTDPAGTATIDTVGSGVVDGPPVTLDEPGWYTFRAELRTGDGGYATHACGVPSETVAVPGITTEASPAEATIGASVRDTVLLAGVAADRPGQLTVTLHGPFATAADVDCGAETVVDRQTIAVVGGGPFTTEPVAPAVAGHYTYVASWRPSGASGDATVGPEGTGGDADETNGSGTAASGAGSAAGDTPSPSLSASPDVDGQEAPAPMVIAHECGLAAETVTVSPAVTTQVAETDVAVGEDGRAELRDLATVTGPGDEEVGTVRFSLFGPFPADGDMTCDADTHLTTVTASITGPGDVLSPAVGVDRPGRYTWMASWRGEVGDLEVAHACGLVEETALVGVVPTAATPSTIVRGLAVTGGSTRVAFGGACLVAAGMCLVAGVRRWPVGDGLSDRSRAARSWPTSR